MNRPQSDIRIASLAPASFTGMLLKLLGPALDWLLGISQLRRMYLNHQLAGLDKQTFAKKLIETLGVQVIGGDALGKKIPVTGRCIVVCNHPYGMIEGVIISYLLTQHRSDTKVMANVGLKIFKEISDYFLFANPLKPTASINSSAIKQCFNHLNNDGLLVIFPAGRVSFFHKDKQRITDGEWNRIAIQLARKTQSPILPVFISGTNSTLFYRMGRVYYRFRLLMLVREMLKLTRKTITLSANNLIHVNDLSRLESSKKMNDFVRLQCYLNDENYYTPWPLDGEQQVSHIQHPILAPVDNDAMLNELSQLPAKQHLLDFKSYSVYYGYQIQIPNCVREITRLREQTFRLLNEGSGEACDTDKYDETYMHLFIFDHQDKSIIGAYRIGQTDRLLAQGDITQLYLSQMFNFDRCFVNQNEPCLEMGRSFIVPEHQQSFHGLLLLWKGIGAFVCQNPQYRTLYGTVSLSKLYDPRSVSLINRVMVTNNEGVKAKLAFEGRLHPEVEEFFTKTSPSIELLSTMVSSIEDDGKDIPILLKQYHKLGAKFHCIAIDPNFSQTPGLLLSVDLPKAPDKLLKLYLGRGKHDYLAFERD